MNNTWFRVLAGLVLLVAIAGIGYFAYNAGMAQAAVVGLAAAPGTTAAQPAPYYAYGMPFWHPYPLFGFGCLGLLVPLFFVCLAFAAFRRMLWGPRWGWHHMRHSRWMDEAGNAGLPPMFAEWHRRAHGESNPEPKQ
jgi:hypothetical protein